MRKELIKCPMCEGSLESRTDFNDPNKGLIKNIYYQACINCDELFFPPGIADRINQYSKRKISA